MVIAGTLRHKINLQSKTGTPDEYGEPIESWTTYATVRARISPLSGEELIAAQQVQAETTHNVEIRYRAAVTTTNKIIFGSRTLEIVSIVNPDERNKNQILLCRELV
jgi:SPP1 family predicted phage head-tail adaptor